MNDAPASSTAKPASESWLEEPKPHREGWSQSKLIFLIVLALAAHIGFIFVFGTKKPVAARPVSNVPYLQLADNASELIALDDPTLFALPHKNDYATAFWQRPPAVPPPNFRWTEPPRWLPAPKNLGAAFAEFMRTNPPLPVALNFKPPPPFAEFLPPAIPLLPQTSTVQLGDGLTQRRLVTSINPPDLTYNDVIAPSRVQVLVDLAGKVISTVLLPSDSGAEALGHWEFADQRALTLARAAHFTPGSQMTFGELIFNWHTLPTTNHNASP